MIIEEREKPDKTWTDLFDYAMKNLSSDNFRYWLCYVYGFLTSKIELTDQIYEMFLKQMRLLNEISSEKEE